MTTPTTDTKALLNNLINNTIYLNMVNPTTYHRLKFIFSNDI